MDLTGISPLDPQDTELVSKGAGRIRDTREAIIESFGGVGDNGAGGTQPEHRLNGVHKFPNGGLGALPAAGNLGRIFLDTIDGGIGFDNGSAWQFLHALPVEVNQTPGPVALNPIFQTTNTLSITNIASAVLVVFANWGMLITGTDGVEAQIVVDGSNLITPAGSDWRSSSSQTLFSTRGTIISAEVVAAGTHTVQLQFKDFAGGTATVSGMNLIAVFM